jgi:hypothetical protein
VGGVLDRVAREILLEESAFELKPEQSEGKKASEAEEGARAGT